MDQIIDDEVLAPRFGQVIRWHLTDAKRAGSQREDNIAVQPDMVETYLTSRFKSRRFADIDAGDMRWAIDKAGFIPQPHPVQVVTALVDAHKAKVALHFA